MTTTTHRRHRNPNGELVNKSAFHQSRRRALYKKALLSTTITLAVLMVVLVLVLYSIE